MYRCVSEEIHVIVTMPGITDSVVMARITKGMRMDRHFIGTGNVRFLATHLSKRSPGNPAHCAIDIAQWDAATKIRHFKPGRRSRSPGSTRTSRSACAA